MTGCGCGREEGSNGDREMASAMWMSGLEPWDITMSDLLNGRASLDSFRGERACQLTRTAMQAMCLSL